VRISTWFTVLIEPACCARFSSNNEFELGTAVSYAGHLYTVGYSGGIYKSLYENSFSEHVRSAHLMYSRKNLREKSVFF
jgi:hypothetical protein